MCPCCVSVGGRGSEEQAEEEVKEDKVKGRESEGGSATPLARCELILCGTPRHLELLMGPEQLSPRRGGGQGCS